MATAHTGRDGTLKGVNRCSEFIMVGPGLLFNHAEAVKLGVHDNVTMQRVGVTNHEGMGGGVPDHTLYTGNFKMYQATWPNFESLDMLAQQAINVRAKFDTNTGGIWWNFIDTPDANLGAPSGTTERMGLGLKLLITQNECTIEGNLKTRMSLLQDEQLWTIATAAHTGETGGTSLGVTAISYNRSQYTPGNVKNIKIINSAGGTANIGFIGNDFEFMMESVIGSHDEDTLEKTLATKYKYTLKASGLQMSATDAKAWNTDMREDTTCTIYLMDGRTITISNFMLNLTNHQASDDQSFIEFEGTREVTRPNITFGATDLALATPTSGF